LGRRGSQGWRDRMKAGLMAGMINEKKYHIETNSRGALVYTSTMWMVDGEVVWVSTPISWWPAVVDSAAREGVVPAEKILVKMLGTGDVADVDANTSAVLPFRLTFEKLSALPPSDARYKKLWHKSIKAALKAEEGLVDRAVEAKLERSQLAESPDFVPDVVVQRVLSSFIRKRAEQLQEALLHEQLDKQMDDIGPEELAEQELDDRIWLADSIQRVLEVFTKELFVHLYECGDEERRSTLMNLWQRLSHLERGRLTSNQVAAALLKTVDVEVLRGAVQIFSQIRDGSTSAEAPDDMDSPVKDEAPSTELCHEQTSEWELQQITDRQALLKKQHLVTQHRIYSRRRVYP